MIIEFTEYLHGSKESAWWTADQLQAQHGFTFSQEAMDTFKYAFCEVELKCTLDTETGIVKVISVI